MESLSSTIIPSKSAMSNVFSDVCHIKDVNYITAMHDHATTHTACFVMYLTQWIHIA